MISRFVDSIKNYFYPSTPTQPQLPLDLIFNGVLRHLDDVQDILNVFRMNKAMYAMLNKGCSTIFICAQIDILNELATQMKKRIEEESEKVGSTKYPGNYHFLLERPRPSDLAPNNLEVNVSNNDSKNEITTNENSIQPELKKLSPVRPGTYADLLNGFKNSHGYDKIQSKIVKIKNAKNKCCPRVYNSINCKLSVAALSAAGIFTVGTSIAATAIIGPQCSWIDNYVNRTYEDYAFNQTTDQYDYFNVTIEQNNNYLSCPDDVKAIIAPVLGVGYPMAALLFTASTVFCFRAKFLWDKINKREESKSNLISQSNIFLIHSNLFTPSQIIKDQYVIDIDRTIATRDNAERVEQRTNNPV